MMRIFGVRGREMSERPAGRRTRRRTRQRFFLEHLEPKTLLTATLPVTAAGAASFLAQTAGSGIDLKYDMGTHTYTFDDNEGIAPGTVDPAFTYTQVSGSEATLAPVDPATQDFTSLSFDQNVEDISYFVTSLSTATTFVDTSLPTPSGTPQTDTFNFGTTGDAQSLITAPVTVALTKESATINVDDSLDPSAQTIDMSATQVDFHTTPSFNYSGTNVAGLNVMGGSGDNTVNVTGTPNTGLATITLGNGNDQATVLGTGLGTTPTPNLSLQGGTGVNTLAINSTGTSTSISPGTVTFGTGAELVYSNFSSVQITGGNAAPVISPAPTITVVQKVPLVFVVVATFTDTDTVENASSYTATIDWGDGSMNSAGTVAFTGTSTVGGVTANDYSISGTHTYVAGGTYTTQVTVTDLGGSFSSTVGGVPVTTTLVPLAPITDPGATINVNALTPGSPATPAAATAGTLVVIPSLVTFTDGPAPLPATAYSATINWGDGSALNGGTITQSGTTFTVAGSHNYSQDSGSPYTISVVIAGDGQQMTVTTTATVVDLTSVALPTPPTATAGTTITSPLTVGIFTAVPNPDPTAYSAVVDWGDGSTPVVGTITGVTTGATTVLDVTTSGHNYAQTGSESLTVTLTDSQGFVIGTATPTLTVGGLSVSPVVGLNVMAGTPTGSLTVATFTGTPNPVSAGYTALVDWGDGSMPVVATITPLAGGVFAVTTSGHTYAQGGSYVLSVTIRDGQGFVVGTASPAITVGVMLSGRLSPQSDSGVSDSDGITNITTPTFVGNTSPGTTVEVFAAPSGSSVLPGTEIAVCSAEASGFWSATVVNAPLADGSYTITAEAVSSSGTVLGTASLGTVVIDTVGPVINAVSFDRFTDTVTVTYQDNLSGLDYASIANGAFYHLSAKPLAKNVRVPRMLLPTSITITPGATATAPEVVKLVFNHGHTVRGGRYTIVIDSGVGDTGIQDVAGNALDGEFYGSFPSGDGLPGGNFVATIATFHNNVVLSPVPVQSGYVSPRAAVDPLAHATTTKKVVKVVVHATAKVVNQPVEPVRVHHDLAIEALTIETKAKRRRTE